VTISNRGGAGIGIGLLQTGNKKYKKATINQWHMQEHQEVDSGGGINTPL